MKYLIMILSIMILLTFNLIAQVDGQIHPIDKWHQECLEQEDNQNTIGMTECDNLALEKWDKELNKVYNSLIKKLTPKGKETLKNSQKAWLKFRDAEYNAIAEMYGNLDGTMWMNVRSSFTMDIIRDRVLQLQSYLDALNDAE